MTLHFCHCSGSLLFESIMSQSLLLSHSKACAWLRAVWRVVMQIFVRAWRKVCAVRIYVVLHGYVEESARSLLNNGVVYWVSFFAILFWFKTKVGATAISFISLNDYTTMIFLSEAVGKSEEPILTRAWWRFQVTIHRRPVHRSVLSLIPMSAQAGRRRR